MVRIGIIGTAGRKEDKLKMSKDLYDKMKSFVIKIIDEILKLESNKESQLILVSGGAAWSDHLAVTLFLQDIENENQRKLQLYLPCEWDSDKKQFIDLGIFDPYKNSGGTSNYYHKLFTEKMGHNTLEDLHLAIQKGANVKTEKGFYARNSLVANDVDYLIAFTWGQSKEEPKDGGTLHTWNCCPKEVKKIHVPLSLL